MRVGIGSDVHRFVGDRPLVLGGVRIQDAPGLAGHSDADVLCHAVADAVLGAAGLGDIGAHFPDSDPAWKDASSLDLLARVAEMIGARSLRVVNVDATVLLEAPRLAGHRDDMRANLATALAIDVDVVSVKASTTEGLGLIGSGEGAACMAVALLAPIT